MDENWKLNWKMYAAALGVGLLVLVAYLMQLWEPERQVTLHSENFLKSVEKRRWSRFQKFISSTYQDQWGHDHETVTQDSQEAFRHFFDMQITTQSPVVEVDGGVGRYTTVLRVDGRGTPVAEWIKERANLLTTPFVLEWQKEGWQPWAWRLVRVENSSLTLER